MLAKQQYWEVEECDFGNHLHLLDQILLNWDVLLDADVQSTLILLGTNQEGHCSFELVALQENVYLRVDGLLVPTF